MSDSSTKKIQLNPADLVIDESMPSYPIALSLSPKATLTDEQVAAGKPLRLAAKKKVSDKLDNVINEKKRLIKHIKDLWDTLFDNDRRKFLKSLSIYNTTEYYELFNYLKSEVVWWDNNLELSVREINTHDLRFDETFATKVKEFVAAMERINAGTNKSPAQKEEEDRREKLRNATLYDDITESLTTVAKSFLLIVYILVGLRCASFAVNENLHLGLEYRILIFIYTFIFTPIFGPYYLWKGIENYIWSTPLTPYEGFFPLYPYDKSDPLTLNRRLYGYLDSPEFQARIQLKKDTIVAERDATVVSKGLRAKIIEEHSV